MAGWASSQEPGTHLSPTIRPPPAALSTVGHLKWRDVTGGGAPRRLRCLVILAEGTVDGHQHPPRKWDD